LGVLSPDEVLVEPLCLLYLEADSLDRCELFVGKVYDEADTEVIEPYITPKLVHRVDDDDDDGDEEV
jgi:hypothetical protein